ncbi:glycosyltransferase family 2 protein [Glycomyces sp. TRM65418]|uniref:glycosyltransferase family 2 protein n=1 Tax=Glycomyces sp. TRM65418 TaxID=2867006 RepID=UPI001CE5249F|nr:glycosyltransferase family A protein [Glycomyces sp. TRM65418]MCC3762782.1 glycosyltransferase family 2 protein [Glycomyces sp. TRM65418]QZD56812.1 glycosyltransferase family 2 protein [Glycomyces sp. TRM65418]
MSTVPDVSVVIPVYNTMPYLTACLDSLAAQTLRPDRFEVVAVDDGSTDGSGAELDRFAAEHANVTVVHQANSGGPAGPCNAALELVRGRYVLFLGSDDYLGTEALERMTAAADEWGSEVLLCKMVGVGGRKAPPVFERTIPDVDYPNNDLAWALSNTKLFSRELIEREGLRFPEGMQVLSDGPFTLRAMAKARRVSVEADYDHYYAVKREQGENLTYATAPFGWIDAAERLIALTVELFPPGEGRDDLIYRVFSREIHKCLQPHFLGVEPADRREYWEAVADFCDEHLTEQVRRRLPTEKRVRVSLAHARDWDLLEESLRADSPTFLVEDGRVFVRYPGFRDGRPDEWYLADAERVTGRLAKGIVPVDLAWAGDRKSGHFLEYWFRLPVAGLEPDQVSVGVKRLGQGEPAAPRHSLPVEERTPLDDVAEIELRPDGDTVIVAARLSLEALAGGPGRWSLRTQLTMGAFVYDLPLKTVRGPVQRHGRPLGMSVDWGARRSVVMHSVGRPSLKRRVASLVGLNTSRK